MLRLAVVFPGQGTQAPGLGHRWRRTSAWSDLEAAGVLDATARRLLLDATADELMPTAAAQRTVLLASLLAWTALRSRLTGRAEPVVFAGHSLGQITALIAAGALPLHGGTVLAMRRAGHTHAAASRAPGGMLALLGADLDGAAAACAAAPDACWVAADNAPGQVVLGGTPAGLDAAAAAARAARAGRPVPLPVAGAFHTPLMAEAAEALRVDVALAPFRRPRSPVLSNLDASAPSDTTAWRRHTVAHLVEPVRWRAVQEALATRRPDLLVEVGPGDTLATLAKRTIPHIPRASVGTPDEVEELAAALDGP